MAWCHGSLQPQGPDRYDTAGTLTLKTDATGVYYEVEPPRSAIGNHVYELVARGDVSESSFAFVVQ